MSIQVGQPAPSFESEALIRGRFEKIKLSDYRGEWLCLYFYPLDFTFVCPTEIIAFNKAVPEFEARGCQLVACSTDSVHSHLAWVTSHPGLKDMAHAMIGDTNHSVSRAYNVLVEDEGIALRGTFLIDPEGILRWSSVCDLNVGRSVAETLRMLDALTTGELTPCEWHQGEETLVVA